jgi:hypothetical protein
MIVAQVSFTRLCQPFLGLEGLVDIGMATWMALKALGSIEVLSAGSWKWARGVEIAY